MSHATKLASSKILDLSLNLSTPGRRRGVGKCDSRKSMMADDCVMVRCPVEVEYRSVGSTTREGTLAFGFMDR